MFSNTSNPDKDTNLINVTRCSDISLKKIIAHISVLHSLEDVYRPKTMIEKLVIFIGYRYLSDPVFRHHVTYISKILLQTM